MSSDFLYPSICLVSMGPKMRLAFKEAGKTPDYDAVIGHHEGVRLVDVLNKGRCARIEVSSEEDLLSLQLKLGDQYLLSPKIQFEPL